jgi:hypothetical protein
LDRTRAAGCNPLCRKRPTAFFDRLKLYKRKKKKRGANPSSFSILVLLLNLTKHLAVIGHAGLAQPVGQPICAALGAGRDCGSCQLPVGTPLIPSLLRDFTLRNRHFETPPW